MVDIKALTEKKRQAAQDQIDLCGEAMKLLGGGDIGAHEARLVEIAALLTNPEALPIVQNYVTSLQAVENFFGTIAAGHERSLKSMQSATTRALPSA